MRQGENGEKGRRKLIHQIDSGPHLLSTSLIQKSLGSDTSPSLHIFSRAAEKIPPLKSVKTHGKMVSAISYYRPSYGDLKAKLLAPFQPLLSALIFNGSHHVIRSSHGGKRRKLCFQFHVFSFGLGNKNVEFLPFPLPLFSPPKEKKSSFRHVEGRTMESLLSREKESSLTHPCLSPGSEILD